MSRPEMADPLFKESREVTDSIHLHLRSCAASLGCDSSCSIRAARTPLPWLFLNATSKAGRSHPLLHPPNLLLVNGGNTHLTPIIMTSNVVYYTQFRNERMRFSRSRALQWPVAVNVLTTLCPRTDAQMGEIPHGESPSCTHRLAAHDDPAIKDIRNSHAGAPVFTQARCGPQSMVNGSERHVAGWQIV
jgi:hypothetical protein